MNPATAYVDHLTQTLADRWGLSHWETVLRPRHHARIEATQRMLAATRAGALAAQGKRARDAKGRFMAASK